MPGGTVGDVESDPTADSIGGSGEAAVQHKTDGGGEAEPQSREAANEDPSERTTEEGPDGDEAGDPLRFSNWMKRSATGAVMTGIAFGLKEALQPRQQQTAFVIEAPGEPEDPDKPIDLRFDPESPADTVAIIRRPRGAEPPGPPAHSS
jgi:hypothetical protein